VQRSRAEILEQPAIVGMLGLHVQLIVRLPLRPADLTRKIERGGSVAGLHLDVGGLGRAGRPAFDRRRLEPREQRPRVEAEAAEQAGRLHVAQLGGEVERAGHQVELARDLGFGLGNIAHGQLADAQAAVHRAGREPEVLQMNAVPGQAGDLRLDRRVNLT
jgi:hypothetical protein